MNETERRYAARRQLWEQAFAGMDLTGKTVLDAGTGEGHFTCFLASRSPDRLVSVTCRPEEIPSARTRLRDLPRPIVSSSALPLPEPANSANPTSSADAGYLGGLLHAESLADRVEFRVADLTHLHDVPDNYFDIVGADFLIAAVAGLTPFREIECLRELLRVLRPGGRIVLTGWETTPNLSTTYPLLLREMLALFRLREAVHQLLGSPCFREFPRFWLENRLREMGHPPERTCLIPDLHRDFSWFGLQIRAALADLDAPDLRDALDHRLRQLEARVLPHPAFQHGLQFGQLYALIACKLSGATLLHTPFASS